MFGIESLPHRSRVLATLQEVKEGDCLSSIVVSGLRTGPWQQAVSVRRTEHEAEEAKLEEHRGHIAA